MKWLVYETDKKGDYPCALVSSYLEAVQIVLVICMCENIRDGYSITIKPVKGGDNNDPITRIK